MKDSERTKWCWSAKIFSYKVGFCGWLSGNLERIGIELGQHRSDKEGSQLPNGFTHELEENAPSDLQGGVIDPHQQLLIVLSNIGYCKDELSYELYDKYRHIWLHSRYCNCCSLLVVYLFYISKFCMSIDAFKIL